MQKLWTQAKRLGLWWNCNGDHEVWVESMQKCDGERSRLQKQCCHSWLKLRGENVYQTDQKQKLLRESAKKGIWPSTKESNAGSSESELEFEPGQKENENTPMKEWTSFWNSLKNLIGKKVPTKVFCSWWKICLPAQVQLDWCRNLTLCLLKRSFTSWKTTCLTFLCLELRTQICTSK